MWCPQICIVTNTQCTCYERFTVLFFKASVGQIGLYINISYNEFHNVFIFMAISLFYLLVLDEIFAIQIEHTSVPLSLCHYSTQQGFPDDSCQFLIKGSELRGSLFPTLGHNYNACVRPCAFWPILFMSDHLFLILDVVWPSVVPECCHSFWYLERAHCFY